MFRSTRLLCTACLALFAISPALARQTMPADPTPGWAIIVAADYTGPQGKLYHTVQHDALRAYTAAVTRWHLPPSHIILLAEGDDINNFVKHGTLSDTMQDQQHRFTQDVATLKRLHPATAASILQQARTYIKDDATLHKLGEYEGTFLDDGNSVPLYGAPNRENFLLARNMVTLLATSNQFVAYVVSTHAAPTSKLAALKQQSGALDDNGCLSAADFNLSNCAAHSRLLVLDAQNRFPGETLPATSQADALASVQSQMLGAGGTTAVVLASSDGTTPSGTKPDYNESFFLWQFFADASAPDPLHTSTLGSLFKHVNSDYKCGLFDVDPPPSAVMLPQSAQDLSIQVAFNVPKTSATERSVALRPISADQIAVVQIPSLGTKRGGIVVGEKHSAPLFEVTAASVPALQKRGDLIVAGFKALVTSKGLTRADLQQITVKREGKYQEYVVTLPRKIVRPDGADYLVTADEQTASAQDLDPKEMASDIAHKVRKIMDVQYATTAALAPMNERDYYNQGLLYLENRQFDKAEESLSHAIGIAGGYTEAHLLLAETYIMDHRIQQASAELDRFSKLIDRKALEPTTRQLDKYNELEEDLTKQ